MEDKDAILVSLDEIAESMRAKLQDLVYTIEEVSRVHPTLKLKLKQTDEGLLAVTDVAYPDKEFVSPVELTERILATDIIRFIVNRELKVASPAPDPEFGA